MTSSNAQIYLIPCTIAPESLQVISPQIIQVISLVDYYVVENIRTARRFIGALKIRDVSTLHFEQFDKDSDPTKIPAMMAPAMNNQSIGIISEAGCPAVADPGNLLVRWAHDKGIKVVPLSGPSSILLALMGSGMNGQHFEFHGYLPIEKAGRAKILKQLENDSARTGKTQVFMETPYRNNKLAQTLVEQCRDETLVCFASEVTGENETILTKSVVEWRGNLPDLHKRPTIFLLQAGSAQF